MSDSPADTVAAVLRYIECYRDRNGTGPPAGKEFRENGFLAARVEGTVNGVTELTVRSKGHAWRLSVFGAARGLSVAARVGELVEG